MDKKEVKAVKEFVIREAFKFKTKEDFYRVHFGISNFIFPVKLSEKEIEVLSAFLGEHPELTKDDMFNTFVRKRVREKLNLSYGGLGNYLRDLKEKGYIVAGENGKLQVRPEVLPPEEHLGFQRYALKLMMNGKEE